MCRHKCSQGVENRGARSAAKPWKPSGMENFCRVPAETIETYAIFRPVTKMLPTQKRTPKWSPFTQSEFDLLVSGQLGPSVSGPQNGCRFCRQKSSRRAKNSASFHCFRGYATELLHTAGFPWFCSATSTCSPHPANIYVHTCS